MREREVVGEGVASQRVVSILMLSGRSWRLRKGLAESHLG
jgi:hypothetical protein